MWIYLIFLEWIHLTFLELIQIKCYDTWSSFSRSIAIIFFRIYAYYFTEMTLLLSFLVMFKSSFVWFILGSLPVVLWWHSPFCDERYLECAGGPCSASSPSPTQHTLQLLSLSPAPKSSFVIIIMIFFFSFGAIFNSAQDLHGLCTQESLLMEDLAMLVTEPR